MVTPGPTDHRRQRKFTVNENLWVMVALTALAVVYIGVRNYLSNRSLKKEDRSDEELVATLAMVRETNAFEVFKSAGRQWNFSDSKIQRDFEQYLTLGDIPRYVVSYARENITEADLEYRDLIHPRGGGRPPAAGAG
jgi:hypothetical protein